MLTVEGKRGVKLREQPVIMKEMVLQDPSYWKV